MAAAVPRRDDSHAAKDGGYQSALARTASDIGFLQEQATIRSLNRKLTVAFAAAMVLASQRAVAASTDGSYALGLASVIAAHSPILSREEKRVMARLFGGHADVAVPATSKISVRADAVVCVESDIDITKNSCTLTFGARKVSLSGRSGHELFATLVVAGVPPDPGAGSIFERVAHLVCTISPHIIAQRAGGGAGCTFHPGP